MRFIQYITTVVVGSVVGLTVVGLSSAADEPAEKLVASAPVRTIAGPALSPALVPAHSEPVNELGANELNDVVAHQQDQLDQQRRLIEAQSALLEKLQKSVADLSQAINDRLPPSRVAVLGYQARQPDVAQPPMSAALRPGPAAQSQTAPSGVSAAAATSPPASVAPEQKSQKLDPATFRAYWSKGLRFDTSNKDVQLKIGGRIMNDWGFFAPSDEVKSSIGPLEDGTEFRRARLYVEGLLNQRVEFKAQYDFAGGSAGFKDVFIGLKKLPGVGNLRLGHFKEPFSLESQTSSRYITFMERALPFALAPERNAGAMLRNAVLDGKMTWAFGVFREGGSFGNDIGNGGFNYTGRLTGRPWYQDGGRKLLHVGMAYRHGNPADNQLRYRSRPEAHLTARFVDTRMFDATSTDTVGTEFAVVLGPTSLQSEYIFNSVDRPAGQRENFSSFYIQGSYFLTGEHRIYKGSDGAFDRIKPNSSFGDMGGRNGKGAWQIAARYSRLDLSDTLILGGELQDFTLGLNWYLNPNTRFMWNYGLADRVDLGTANLFQTRFQVDF